LLDLLRADGFALVMEFGDPQKPADAQVLVAYSPYHNVRRAFYPAVLLGMTLPLVPLHSEEHPDTQAHNDHHEQDHDQ
jgi:prolyl oligopeptidase PreP (S9A serine peptidase family)